MNPRTPKTELLPGHVVWADFSAGQGNEQQGRRPAVVLSTRRFQEKMGDLVIVAPISGTQRGWLSHVPVTFSEGKLAHPSWVMTEQIRTVSGSRLFDTVGRVDEKCFTLVRGWVRQHLGYYPQT